MSQAFASEGASVVCQDLDEGAAKSTVEAIAAAGGPEAMAWSCDVSDSGAIDTMFDAATTRYGLVNVLVNYRGSKRWHRLTPDNASFAVRRFC